MCIPPSHTLLKNPVLLSTSSLIVVPDTPWDKAVIPPQCACTLVYTCFTAYIRMYHAYKFASQIPLALYYLSFSFQCSAYNQLLICVEPHWASESSQRGWLEFSFRLSNQRARLTEECLEAKQGELLIQGSAGCGNGNLRAGAQQKTKSNKQTNKNPPFSLRRTVKSVRQIAGKNILEFKSPFCIKLNSWLCRVPVNYIWACMRLITYSLRNFKVSRIFRQNGWLSTNDTCWCLLWQTPAIGGKASITRSQAWRKASPSHSSGVEVAAMTSSKQREFLFSGILSIFIIGMPFFALLS